MVKKVGRFKFKAALGNENARTHAFNSLEKMNQASDQMMKKGYQIWFDERKGKSRPF
jgi:hypothetical protein